ncbi:LutC/YkgG family protein [Virgibacillus ndiopensis]|uniref:LutC/YkgG family protein n=1 Tax=Virgibacillus ndiopensis TaxID=2004408 RepID=UPI000C07E9E8|nr:lactate utilization protein C [Virgibacillus ndiopensis]
MAKGMIHNRDVFLENISKNLGRKRRMDNVGQPLKQLQPQTKVFKNLSSDALLKKLKDQCKRIHTEILETDTASLTEVLADLISVHGNGPIVTSEDSRFFDYGLRIFLERDDVLTWDPSRGQENIDYAERSNVGIMFSDITLAESATVVHFNDREKARSISLLPTTYIAIIPKSTIVPRFTQAAQEIDKRIAAGETIASCVNFISGPSNSADIEYNLVVGVHGPVKVSYIVLLDR